MLLVGAFVERADYGRDFLRPTTDRFLINLTITHSSTLARKTSCTACRNSALLTAVSQS